MTKKYEILDLGLSPYVNLIHYFADDLYTVSTKRIGKNFKLTSYNKDFLQEAAYEREYAVKERYIQNAIEWMLKDNRNYELKNFNVYTDINIPKNVVLMHPSLLSLFISNSF